MKKFLTICLTICSCLISYAQAIDLVVDCQTPGWLSSKINYGDQQTVRNLKVTGYINENDLKFLGSLIQNEQLDGAIDLSDCSIAGKDKDYLSENCFGINTYDTLKIRYLSLPKTLKGLESILRYKNNNALIVDTLLFDCEINKVDKYMFERQQFAKTPINLILGEKVDTILEYSFSEHKGIKSVEFSKSIRYIGNGAFTASSLAKINIEAFDSIDYLGYSAFPVNLDTLVFPKKLTVFHASTFCYNDNAHIFLHENVKAIQAQETPRWKYGFNLSGHLNIHFKTLIPPANDVYLNDIYTIFVPKGAKEAYANIYNFKDATIIEENPVISVKLSTNELFMDVAQKKQLSVEINPVDADDKTTNWNSADNNIASVNDNGLVTAIAPGQTYIYVTSIATGIKDSCLVTVRKNVTGVEFEDPSIYLTNIGDSRQLKVKITPEDATEQTVTYESLNEAICHVTTNGLVIAIDYGTAVVTATTVDGGHTAICTVRVVHNVETVEMDKHEVTMKAMDTMQLTAKVLPDNAYDKTVTWTSSNDSLATVDANGIVKALAVGEVYIKATSSVNSEAYDSCRVNIVKRIEVTDSTIVWNDTVFVYTGLSPQPTWKNRQEEYSVTAEMPELEKNVGSWETTVPFVFTDGVDTLVVDVPLRYTITPALLTIKANDAERYYGEENPEFVFTYEGFVNDESEEVLTQKPMATTAATAESPVGTYPITVEGAEADNYTIEYEDGILTVKENPEEVGEDVTDIVTATEVTLKAGENTTLTVSLTTKDTDYIGYQFNLYLPEGISVATDDNGYFLVTEKTGREKVALAVSDGSVLFYTTADKDHDALVSGPLMEIELTADLALDAGNYTVRIERIICATRENKTVSLSSSTVTVTVEKEAEEEVPAVITADDVEGEPASRITLPVFLNNAKDINAFYFDLTLPKGVVVATEKNGQFIASFVGDYADGTMLLSCLPWDASMGTTNNVNTWRFIATPKDNGVFHANAGRVMNVMLDVDKDMAGGVYTARMNVVKLVEANDAASSRAFDMMRAPANADSWTSYSTITIKTQKQGDVNGDFTVDVADIATVIDVMAGSADVSSASADVNGDGTVDVADIAAIIDTMAANARRQR